MDWFSFAVCVTSILCVSGRGALLVVMFFSLTLLLMTAVMRLWQHKQWGAPTMAAVLLSVGAGGGLWRCFAALSAQNAQDLGPVLPLCAVALLCAFSAKESPSTRQLVKASIALLTVGCVRELLSTASLFGYPFAFSAFGTTFGRGGNDMTGAGGLLIACAVLWLFGIRFDLPKPPECSVKDVLCLGLSTASCSLVVWALQTTIPSVSGSWLFFASLLLAAPVLTFTSLPILSLLFPPILACFFPPASPISALLSGAVATLLWPVLVALADRLHRARLPRRFAGAPLFLTAAAVGVTIFEAVG